MEETAIFGRKFTYGRNFGYGRISASLKPFLTVTVFRKKFSFGHTLQPLSQEEEEVQTRLKTREVLLKLPQQPPSADAIASGRDKRKRRGRKRSGRQMEKRKILTMGKLRVNFV